MKVKEEILNGLVDQTEITKALVLIYFESKENNKENFDINEVLSLFNIYGFNKPNQSRLFQNLKKSKYILSDRKNLRLNRLGNKFVDKLLEKYLEDETIHDYSSLIPNDIFQNTRGYLEKICLQINACYSNYLYDACAVMMRRLVEILLILSYENLSIDHEIKNCEGNYKYLDSIIRNAKSNATLTLSRNSKAILENIKDLGNFAAHKIYYNTTEQDITPFRMEFRALVEELLYKAGIKI